MEKATYSESSSDTETEEDDESEDQEDEEDTKKTAVSNKGNNKSKVQNKKSPQVQCPTGICVQKFSNENEHFCNNGNYSIPNSILTLEN